MFYVLGDAVDRSATPRWVEGELYRANAISNFDTAALRCMTTNGVELLFYSTHAAQMFRGPEFIYEFDHASVTYQDAAKEIVATFRDGRTRTYGSPDAENHRKLILMANAMRRGVQPLCGVETALSHTLCVNGVQESVPHIVEFPREFVRCDRRDNDQWTYVEGLDAVYDACYAAGVLLSEQGVAWARKGRRIALDNYTTFPSL